MKQFLFSLTILALLTLSACIRPAFCTEEFVMITVKIEGAELDQTYTIEESTGDTVLSTTGPNHLDSYYLVLDDSYQAQLERDERSFRFIGIQQDSTVLSEIFEIGADNCHVYKASGLDEINL